MTSQMRVGIGTDARVRRRPSYVARRLVWEDQDGLEGIPMRIASHAICDAVCRRQAWEISVPWWERMIRVVRRLGCQPGGPQRLLFVARASRLSTSPCKSSATACVGERRRKPDVLSAALGAPVSVSGTTTDGLGLTGRGEGSPQLLSLSSRIARGDTSFHGCYSRRSPALV